MTRGDIPHTTVSRLPLYLRCLDRLPVQQETVSSEDIATALGLKAAQVRRDLWYLDCEGRRGVGYDIQSIISQIVSTLGLNLPLTTVIVGMGNLGTALAGYQGFVNRGLTLAGVYDTDPRRIGEKVGEIFIRHPDHLLEDVAELGVSIGVIATPTFAAQGVADLLVKVGVTSILNFVPVVLRVPQEVTVRRVDVATELLILGYQVQLGRTGIGWPLG